MSQEKVERRKYEKYNRKKLERQRKIKITVKCILAALVLGAIIGVPLGINYYRSIPKFVGDATLSAFVGNYIEEAHASDVPDFSGSSETSEESVEDELIDAIEEAVDAKDSEADSEETADQDGSENEADSESNSEE
ncbi:MAG: hypothetical protein NC347_03040 [Clostridium sp.]|nr:hypothetical protein [Clostridium sp.]